MKNNTKYSTNNRKYSEIMKNNESLQMQKWDGAESSENLLNYSWNKYNTDSWEDFKEISYGHLNEFGATNDRFLYFISSCKFLFISLKIKFLNHDPMFHQSIIESANYIMHAYKIQKAVISSSKLI